MQQMQSLTPYVRAFQVFSMLTSMVHMGNNLDQLLLAAVAPMVSQGVFVYQCCAMAPVPSNPLDKTMPRCCPNHLTCFPSYRLIGCISETAAQTHAKKYYTQS